MRCGLLASRPSAGSSPPLTSSRPHERLPRTFGSSGSANSIQLPRHQQTAAVTAGSGTAMIVPLLILGISSHFQPARMRQRPVVGRTAPHELESRPAVVAPRPAVVADALFDTVVELCEAHAAGADVGFERVPSLFDEVLRQVATSKSRPAWPASAAHAAGWPRLAGAWGNLIAASGAPAGRRLSQASLQHRQDEQALRQQYAGGSGGQLRALTNLTCLQPLEATNVGVQRFDDELLTQHTREGRACVGGECRYVGINSCTGSLYSPFATAPSLELR